MSDASRPTFRVRFSLITNRSPLRGESGAALHDPAADAHDFHEIWKATDKIVYSKTLERASSARTRLERDFDADDVRRMKSSLQYDVSVGGLELAGTAIEAGLVDELKLVVVPIVLGTR